MKTGTIINIQKYSVHDGPGIRTTIFFKGCPLNCLWCHNPESQSYLPQIMFFKERCTGCGICVENCPSKALIMERKIPKIISEKCLSCGQCEDSCPYNARQISGNIFTESELMKEIKKDELFYEQSGGGVTFSGGEPLSQLEFLSSMLSLCNNAGIHTCLDTCGFSSWENLKKISDKVDLFLYDLKFMDEERHKKYTGVSNKAILENLKNLSDSGKRIFIRMPLISGINDGDDIIKSAEFLSALNIEQVNLLPYHKMGIEKYERVGVSPQITGMVQPSDQKMSEIQNIFKNYGVKTKIGG